MKKRNQLKALLLASFSLFACAGQKTEGYTLYKSTFDTGAYAMELLTSETSTDKVYAYLITLHNEDQKSLTFEAKDFSIKDKDGKSYTAKYFVKSYGFSAGATSISDLNIKTFVKETLDKVTPEVKQGMLETMLPAFDVNLGEDFSIFYNKVELKNLFSDK